MLSLVFASLLLASSPPTATIAGRVVERGGGPLESATVTLDLQRRAVTGADGTFRFARVEAGRHVLRVERLGFEPNVRTVELSPGAQAEEEVALERFHYEETVIVSATAGPRTTEELYQPVSVLSGAELLAAARTSLGATLESLPGVASSSFGQGAGRPLIRGLGGDRVRVMTNGVEAGDASSVSPDHAVAADVMQAERIEVVRGPATLRWGSNAVGGVVHVMDNRIPDDVPQARVTGLAQVAAGTTAEERAASVVLDGGAGRGAWHADGFTRDASDLDTPRGVVPNTWAEGRGGAAGGSFVSERGRLGASAGMLRNRYGSPVEDEVAIDLRQDRLDAEGELRWRSRPFRSLTVRAGRASYRHDELDGGVVATRFGSEVFEARAESSHVLGGRHEGSFGAQWTSRDFEAEGDESFVPPTSTRTLGMFAFQELALRGPWKVQAGARWDARDVAGAGVRRSITGLSASAGLLRAQRRGPGFSLSVSRVVKLPNAEELFSNGPHLATRAYEVGDPALGRETALGIDAGIKAGGERFRIEIDAFAQRFDGFIVEAPTGEEIDGLPVYRFRQGDARFRGGELTWQAALNRHERHHLRFEGSVEHVRAESEGEALPRIPPLTATLTLRYDGPRAWALVRATRASDQDRVAPGEQPTPGWLTVEAQGGWRFLTKASAHDVVVTLTNLTDELALSHASFVKDLVPQPGRGATVAYRVVF